jgi:hypothetical protein
MRLGLRLLAALLFPCSVSACSGQPAATALSDDRALHIGLVNSGTQPLHCRLMFGHWVERDLGLIAPGGSLDLAISQAAKDGALFVMRDDGQRRMMIETILCGRDGDWPASVGQVDLAPARGRRPTRLEASCALPQGGGRVICPPVGLDD